MINLNSSEYDNDFQLTTEKILNLVSDYQIFKFYIDDFVVNKAINSPLRIDKIPSFNIYHSNLYNKLLFHDKVTLEKGDCFIFVSKLFNIDYYTALKKICQDFNLDLPYQKVKGLKKITKQIPKHEAYSTNSEISLGIKSIPFNSRNIEWWKSGGCKLETINRYNIFNCSHIFVTKQGKQPWIIAVDSWNNPSYAYLEQKENISTYKIYSPFNLEHKWINNNSAEIWEGWTQLPESGDILILTKSRKDIISINDVQGIPAISLQAETTWPKKSVINQLKKRFKQIFVLYDQDWNKTTNWGSIYGKKIADEFGLKQIEIPVEYKSTDHFELVQNGHNARKIIHELINKYK